MMCYVSCEGQFMLIVMCFHHNSYCVFVIDPLNTGGIQLGLLLLLIVLAFALMCVPCCLFVCVEDDEDIEVVTGKALVYIYLHVLYCTSMPLYSPKF